MVFGILLGKRMESEYKGATGARAAKRRQGPLTGAFPAVPAGRAPPLACENDRFLYCAEMEKPAA